MLKRIAKNEKGQAMVEFALIVPLLILLLCGIIDFGWIFGNQADPEQRRQGYSQTYGNQLRHGCIGYSQ
jgi:uncharacterized protein (UPF0333 family)